MSACDDRRGPARNPVRRRWRYVKRGVTLSARRLQVATLSPLLALDAARSRLRGASASVDGRGGSTPIQPGAVFAAMPHWRDRADSGAAPASRRVDRSQILADCIASLLDLQVDRVVVAVLTNAPGATAGDLAAHFATGHEVSVTTLAGVASFDAAPAGGHRILVIGWRPGLLRRSGFYLTWAHKELFRGALRDPGFSHLIYLEDDMRFTEESLAYWCRFREPLARHGLLPGFIRYESFQDARYVVDQKAPQRVDQASRPRVVLSAPGSGPDSDLLFVSLDNPYQGMYVLDRELAIEHLSSSPARSPLLSRAIRWPNGVQRREAMVRERAAIGPIFDDVPAGFGSRNVVPVQTPGPGEYRLDPACLIEHLTGNYVRSGSAFGTIRVADMFLPGAGEPHMAGSSPRQ